MMTWTKMYACTKKRLNIAKYAKDQQINAASNIRLNVIAKLEPFNRQVTEQKASNATLS